MVRIPDAVNVASLDTHALIVTVPYDGPADVASSLPRRAAADVLRQIADQLEQTDNQPCGYRLATGQPCPVHDRATAPRPRGLDDLLGHLAGRTPGKHPADGEQPRPHPNPFALDPEQVERAQKALGDAFATFGRKLRTALEEAAAKMQQTGEQADGEHQDDADPRPRIEVDLEQPADPEPIEEQPATPTVVDCAHGYGLLRDSCPGCDHEQETPHDADPVTLRPAWAKRDMRRCRRCTLRPSHPIHKARAAQ
ncbi:hypothetical protein ACFV28_13365 [Streptomyces sp. NPDC059720]|uniref:hypothetical protein n=1 Tax=Streptomyces sp. NPDC059720 TaxID=3346924 RepID=UPI00369E6946